MLTSTRTQLKLNGSQNLQTRVATNAQFSGLTSDSSCVEMKRTKRCSRYIYSLGMRGISYIRPTALSVHGARGPFSPGLDTEVLNHFTVTFLSHFGEQGRLAEADQDKKQFLVEN